LVSTTSRMVIYNKSYSDSQMHIFLLFVNFENVPPWVILGHLKKWPKIRLTQ